MTRPAFARYLTVNAYTLVARGLPNCIIEEARTDQISLDEHIEQEALYLAAWYR